MGDPFFRNARPKLGLKVAPTFDYFRHNGLEFTNAIIDPNTKQVSLKM